MLGDLKDRLANKIGLIGRNEIVEIDPRPTKLETAVSFLGQLTNAIARRVTDGKEPMSVGTGALETKKREGSYEWMACHNLFPIIHVNVLTLQPALAWIPYISFNNPTTKDG